MHVKYDTSSQMDVSNATLYKERKMANEYLLYASMVCMVLCFIWSFLLETRFERKLKTSSTFSLRREKGSLGMILLSLALSGLFASLGLSLSIPTGTVDSAKLVFYQVLLCTGSWFFAVVIFMAMRLFTLTRKK
ncbi:MAG TPA: hypothetical protein PLA25_04205 [Anaerolineaceae bacterium]|nr:hypothetical protein [Anaerolineaceae bacterium]